MKAWLHAGLADVGVLTAMARAAEEVGFHGLALSDHVISPREVRSPYPYGPSAPTAETHYPDVWVTVGALAAVTSELRFVSKVYLAAVRHPIVVARAVGTAALVSGGRVALGVGVGWMREEFDIMGVDFRTRGARLDEHVAVMRRLWSEDWVEHRGTHFDFPSVRLSPRPPDPISVYAGGESPAAIRRAARLDGWLGAAYELDELGGLVDRLHAARCALGDERRAFETMAGLPRVPDLDDWRRLADLGLTSVSVAPWFGENVGDGTRSEPFVRAIHRFGERVLSRA